MIITNLIRKIPSRTISCVAIAALSAMFLVFACESEADTPTPVPTSSPPPTATPAPTATTAPEPTNTPAPQVKAVELEPTATPELEPTAASTPTHTPEPTPTPTPTPEPVASGPLAPDFFLPSITTSGSYSLSQFRDEKSVVLVFYRGFW